MDLLAGSIRVGDFVFLTIGEREGRLDGLLIIFVAGWLVPFAVGFRDKGRKDALVVGFRVGGLDILLVGEREGRLDCFMAGFEVGRLESLVVGI